MNRRSGTSTMRLDQACQQVFLPLVQLIRHQYPLRNAIPKKPGPKTVAGRKHDYLAWLVVSINGDRVLSCKETRSEETRDARYGALRKFWDDHKGRGGLFAKGELSRKVFRPGGPSAVALISPCVSAASTNGLKLALNELHEAVSERSQPPRVVSISQEFDERIRKATDGLTPRAILRKQHNLLFQRLCAIRDSVIQEEGGRFWIEHRDLLNLRGFIPYYGWLVSHDPDARVWIYLQAPMPTILAENLQYQGGVILCLSGLPQNQSDAFAMLRTVGWVCHNNFETVAALAAHAGSDRHEAYLGGLSAAINAKKLLLEAMDAGTSDTLLRTPRNDPAHYTKEAPSALSALHPFLAGLRDFRWVSLFEWDEAYGKLFRVGWELHHRAISPRQGDSPMEDKKFWVKLYNARQRFSHAADALQELSPHDKCGDDKAIVLLGEVLFAHSFHKSPVIFVCRKRGEKDFGCDPAEDAKGHGALRRRHNYLFICFDALMPALLPILAECAKRLVTPCGKATTDSDYKKHVWSCFRKLENEVDDAIIKEFVETALKKFETSLGTILNSDDREHFGKRLIRHMIWVFLHEVQPEHAFRCIAYFPSRIKPNTPSGGCMIAFDKLPSAEDLLLIDNYVTDYFMAKNLVSAEFEPDLPCVYTSAGFERTMLTELERVLVEHESCTLGIAFLDIDGLKEINERMMRYALGSAVIRCFSVALAGYVSKDPNTTFLIGHRGGDEFVIGSISTADGNKSEEDLASVCRDFRPALMNSWKDGVRQEYAFFQRQGRIPRDQDAGGNNGGELTDLLKVLDEDLKGLHFTAGVASIQVNRLPTKNESMLGSYEKGMTYAEKACYVAKRLMRGSIIVLSKQLREGEKREQARENNEEYRVDEKQLVYLSETEVTNAETRFKDEKQMSNLLHVVRGECKVDKTLVPIAARVAEYFCHRFTARLGREGHVFASMHAVEADGETLGTSFVQMYFCGAKHADVNDVSRDVWHVWGECEKVLKTECESVGTPKWKHVAQSAYIGSATGWEQAKKLPIPT